jgi:adenylylsulfate kinase
VLSIEGAEMSWAIWIAGPPASGAKGPREAAEEMFRSRGLPVRLLDLDTIWRHLSPGKDGARAERELLHRALGYVMAQLTEAKLAVIVTTTAPSKLPARAGEPDATAHGAAPYEHGPLPELLLDTTRMDVATATGVVVALAERLAAGARERRPRCSGWAMWITGRPGSGKTTLARRVAEALLAGSMPVRILDLASARAAIVGREWATEPQEALVHRALALTTKILTESGVNVILDATAPRRAWRDVARKWVTHFAEVQLVCPSEICGERERATRWGLGGARSREGRSFWAPEIVVDYEESWHPDLRLHTHAPDLLTAVEEVVWLARRLERAAHLQSIGAEKTLP